MKLSIVVPMYNVEEHIEHCLRSCLNQTDINSDEYEIIIINDGTKDNSLHIAKKIAASHSNVTIVSQENAGLSASRNKGLSLANGDYIWFVDSDDSISNDAVSIIIKTINSYHPDVIKIGYATTNYENSRIIKIHNKDIPTGEYFGCDILNKHKWEPPAQFFIYKTHFMRKHNLEFYIGILHEDNEFTPRMLYFAKSVVVIENVLYFYMLGNPTSITNTIKPKRLFDLITVTISLNNFLEKNITDKETKKTFSKFISLTANTAIHQLFLISPEEKQVAMRQFHKHKKIIYKNFLKSNKLKYKIQGIMMYILPTYIYLKIHQLISQ